jgi:hypothetical protein
MASLVEVTQSGLSRMEPARTTRSTVRRYVEALGGELEVFAILGNMRIKLLGV